MMQNYSYMLNCDVQSITLYQQPLQRYKKALLNQENVQNHINALKLSKVGTEEHNYFILTQLIQHQDKYVLDLLLDPNTK